MRLFLLLLTVGLALGACAHETPLPPALPEARVPYPDEMPGFATVDQLHPAPVLTPVAFPPLPPPVGADPAPTPAPSLPAKGQKPGRVEPPAVIMRDANAEALVLPSRAGYFGGRAEQRYIYQPGKVYLVVSSPQHPTTLFLPAGERLAAPPVIQSCGEQEDACWVVGAVEMGGERRHSEAVILRPSKAGLESTMPLLTQGGRAYFIRLRSQDALGMVAVTWEVPTLAVAVQPDGEGDSGPPSTRPPVRREAFPAPVVALDRLHTAYTIDVTSPQRPPWVPVQVFDDGRNTFIRMREPLDYTSAPAVFGVFADRSPAIVEFTPYTSPESGLTYVVQGLFPQLLLKGTDGLEVTMTRGANVH
jgi:type IV secretory pathway VirB9-like protein